MVESSSGDGGTGGGGTQGLVRRQVSHASECEALSAAAASSSMAASASAAAAPSDLRPLRPGLSVLDALGGGLEEEDPRPVPGALGVNAGLDWPLVDREEALEALAAVVPAEAAEPPGARVGVRFSPSVFMVQIGCSVLENGAKGTPRASPNGLGHTLRFAPENCIEKYV